MEANMIIPIQNRAGNVERVKIPINNTICAHMEENCTMGTKADRIFSGAYAFACCTACPHSCAATAAADMELLLYTDSLRFTVLVAGL